MKKILTLVLLFIASLAHAWQPTQPIVAYMGYKPGSVNEQVFRVLSEVVSENNPGVTFVVESKPGADGVISNNYILTQPANGYHITVPSTITTFVANDISQPTTKKYNWDTFITPIVLGETAFALVAKQNSSVKTYQEFKTLVRTTNKNINIASSSGTFKITYDLWSDEVRVNKKYVSDILYPNSPAVAVAVGGDQTEFGLLPLYYALQFERDGRMRILAVSSNNVDKKLTSAPNMFHNFNVAPGYMLALHPDTPADVVDWFQQEFLRAMQSSRYVEFMANNAITVNKHAVGDSAVKRYGANIRAKFKRALENPAQQ